MGADGEHSSASSSARPSSYGSPSSSSQRQVTASQVSTVSINPLTLVITPKQYELDFWQSSRVTNQLLTVDRTAFVMSSLNLYSGWYTADGLQATPMIKGFLQGLCVMYLLLSVLHQLYMKYRQEQYIRHRDTILLITRLCRGCWMIIMFCVTPEIDIYNYFVAKKLNNNMSPRSVVTQLMSLFTLILLGQCLYYPMKFRHAVVLQLMYVTAVLSTAHTVKCILQSPSLLVGTKSLCEVLQSYFEGLNLLLGLGGECTDEASCRDRSAEELLASWIIFFGLLVPLYVLYVKELREKQNFLRQKVIQMQQNDQLETSGSRVSAGVSCFLSPVVNLGPLLHLTALSALLVSGLAIAEVFVLVSLPPECSVETGMQ